MNDFLSNRFDVLQDMDISTIYKDYIYQVDLLDSDNFNCFIQTTYNHLEHLYEKTRLLQDIIEYLEAYIKNSIQTYTLDCDALLKEIETQRDSVKQYNAYSSIAVPLTSSFNYRQDRNNRILPACSTINQRIVPHYTETEKYNFSSCKKVTGLTAYNSNIKENLSNGYRTFYSLDAPINGGIKEEIQLNFDTEKDVNIINIITANCEVEQIKYLHEGTIEYEDFVTSIIKRTKTMYGINLVLKSSEYIEKTYYIDDSRKSTDCWNKITQNEYDVLLGNADAYTQSELDELLGITAYQNAYAEYLEKVESWKRKRQEVVDINISNGYSDSVESFDVVQSPDTQGLNALNVSTGELNNTIIMKNNQFFFTAENSSNVKIDSDVLKNQINNLDNILPSIERYRYQTISSDKAVLNKLYKNVF